MIPFVSRLRGKLHGLQLEFLQKGEKCSTEDLQSFQKTCWGLRGTLAGGTNLGQN